MWKRTKATAADGDALLVQVRVQNMHGLADHVEPRRFNEIWVALRDTTQRRVARLGASVVETHVSDPNGSRILCAYWGPASAEERSLDSWSTGLLAALQETLRGLPVRTAVSVALCRGKCLYVSVGDRAVSVLGAAVSHISELSSTAPEDVDTIIIDRSLRHAFEAAELTSIEMPGGGHALRLDCH